MPPRDGEGLIDFYHNWTKSILQQLKRRFWKIAYELFRISSMTYSFTYTGVYRPYSLVPDLQFSWNCESFSVPGWIVSKEARKPRNLFENLKPIGPLAPTNHSFSRTTLNKSGLPRQLCFEIFQHDETRLFQGGRKVEGVGVMKDKRAKAWWDESLSHT